MQDYFEQEFNGQDFTKTGLPKGEYEACRFTHCELANTDLTGTRFIDCDFSACNLSLAKLPQTVFQDVVFTGCKLLGLRFDQCSGFLSFRFDHCILNHASFYGTKLKGTHFLHTQLQEVDFTDADLATAVFDHCDLTKAVFENTALQKADFRTARHYSLDPEKNRLKGALFSLPEVIGLLDKYGIRIDR